jgi:hypothetical protein
LLKLQDNELDKQKFQVTRDPAATAPLFGTPAEESTESAHNANISGSLMFLLTISRDGGVWSAEGPQADEPQYISSRLS